MAGKLLTAHNPVSVDLDAVPVLGPDAFSAVLSGALAEGGRLIALFRVPSETGVAGASSALAAVARDTRSEVELCRLAANPSYPSLTPLHPQAQALERGLWESTGIVPAGHPWLKPLRRRVLEAPASGDASFYRLEGEQVHEVAVGPVHAGIIEPGHFRFQCVGETVHHLEIRLGYQHRGVLGFLTGAQSPRWAAVAESVTGDTAVGGAFAHAACLEALSGTRVSPRAHTLRAIALELERMAYHIGDLGALAGDVGFLPTAQYCGRIRGDILNCLQTLSGNRHGRGLIRHGGVLFDPSVRQVDDLVERLRKHHAEARHAVDLLFDSPSALARFENTGRVTREDAEALGLVGPAARASGLVRDTRRDHPKGRYRFQQVPTSLGEHGDVHARALVRSLELDRSAEFALEALGFLPAGKALVAPGPLLPNRVSVALVEAWRGELVHALVTGADGTVVAAEVVDPSVHNWFGLAWALRGQAISDFPLCNKSFNLAYAGHDL